MSRRNFFSNYLQSSVRLVADLQKAYSEVKTELQDVCKGSEGDLNYFESFESAYPLISETAYFLDDEVARLQIDTKDMTDLEIVKAIYNKDRQQKNGHG